MGTCFSCCKGSDIQRTPSAAPSSRYKSMDSEMGSAAADAPMFVTGPYVHTPLEHGPRTQEISRQQQRLVWRKGDKLTAECVFPPKGTVLQEWLAAHVIDFTNSLNSVVGSMHKTCTCQAMTAGSAFTYRWQNADTSEAEDVTAMQYIDKTFELAYATITKEINVLLENEKPGALDNCERLCEKVLKHLFRVFAHLFKQHNAVLVEQHLMPRTYLVFKWFAFFVHEHKLLPQKELLPLKDMISQVYTESGDTAADWDRRLSSMGSDPLDL